MRLVRITLIATLATVAVGAAAQESQFEQGLATLINLNGMLCAKVVSYRKLSLPDAYEVECLTYRGGTAKATYAVSLKSGRASKM